jgi:hypothetical protein
MTWDNDTLRRHVGRVEELLGQLETHRDEPAGAVATQAVRALVDLYGDALARVLALVADAGLVPALVADELLGHLLLIHDLHPDPERIELMEPAQPGEPAQRGQSAQPGEPAQSVRRRPAPVLIPLDAVRSGVPVRGA